MRLWKRPVPEPAENGPNPSSDEARPHPSGEEARRAAQKNLETARAQWPEVRSVSRSLRELRENNGFLELIEHAIQGGHQA